MPWPPGLILLPFAEAVPLVDKVNVLAGTHNEPSTFSHGDTLPLVARPWGFNHWAVQTEGSSAWD